MFQLGEAVRDWRTSVVQHGTVQPGDLDELESHLQDDMEQLAGTGLSEEEAFLIASRRLGTTPELAAEYGKVNSGLVWARRLFWMLAGYVAVSLTLSLVGAFGQWLSTGMMLSGWVESPALRVTIRSLILVALFVPVFVLAVVPEGRRMLATLAEVVAGWVRRHPAWTILMGVVVYLGLIPARFVGTFLLARMVGAEAIGQEALYSGYFHLGWAVFVPMTILGLLIWTYRSVRGART